MTPHTIGSAYVTYEWAFALGLGKSVIPLLRAESETHPVLDRLQNLDFTNHRARPWCLLIEAVTGEADIEVAETPPSKYEIARDFVLSYLEQRGYQMVSFERVRRRISEDYDDGFLEEVIHEYPDDFRPARLKGGKQGMARLR